MHSKAQGVLRTLAVLALALASSNSAMLLVLDSLNEYIGLGLADELAALKAEHQKDPTIAENTAAGESGR